MPLSFLVKQFSKDELYTTIEVVLNNHSKKLSEAEDSSLMNEEFFFIKEKRIFKKIKFEDILFLKSDHVYTEIVLKNIDAKVVRGSLNSILRKSKF